MEKSILIAGFGPGISKAVAEKFGRAGFGVALVARNAERLDAGVKELAAKNIRAAAFPTDLSEPAAARALASKVRERLGPLAVIHWNAYAGVAGDLLTADTAALQSLFDVPVVSLLAAVQGALPDLRKHEDAAVLVTNGNFGALDPAVDKVAVDMNAMGLALANATKRKLVGLLSTKLVPQGVYVGEVNVMGLVKGTAWDDGSGAASIDPATIAARFFDLYRARKDILANVS
jgi:NADP-dependent 3-hydroxy acid dehydrogenase YdfG